MAFGSASGAAGEEVLVEAKAADIREETNCLPTLGLAGIRGFRQGWFVHVGGLKLRHYRHLTIWWAELA
jgi:hypothetical protein